MDKAELIRHEIEKRRDHNLAIGNALFAAMAEEDIELLSFIDSLQKEPVSEELEEAAEGYGIRQGAELKPFAIKYFKAGAKWQEKKDQETIETAIHHAYHNSKLETKEQMMAKAIDAEICEVLDNDYSICEHTHLELFVEPDTLEKNGFKDKDKVKVIVVKED